MLTISTNAQELVEVSTTFDLATRALSYANRVRRWR